MARRFSAALAIAVAYSLGLSSYAAAQVATATISGTVVDESAAVVCGAMLHLVNLATGMQGGGNAPVN